MKTIFDETSRAELIQRIGDLHEGATAGWGKMNLYQMLKHCTLWDAWILGLDKHSYKQALTGKIFGKFAIRRVFKDDRPLDKNTPTSKPFKITEKTGDIKALQYKWTELLPLYADYHNPEFIHDFFGKMTREQIGILAYKHTDHHLRQFNC